jgi:hypothetical protein
MLSLLMVVRNESAQATSLPKIAAAVGSTWVVGEIDRNLSGTRAFVRQSHIWPKCVAGLPATNHPSPFETLNAEPIIRSVSAFNSSSSIRPPSAFIRVHLWRFDLATDEHG